MTTNQKDAEALSREAFEIPPEILELHRHLDAKEIPVVTAIGDAIGYGRLMQLAEQIWKGKEGDRGGEHTVGPCGAFMVPCEHWIKNDRGHCELCCGAGRVTKGVAALAYAESQRALMEATNNQNTAGVINVKGEG